MDLGLNIVFQNLMCPVFHVVKITPVRSDTSECQLWSTSQTQCCNPSETSQTRRETKFPEVCSGLQNKSEIVVLPVQSQTTLFSEVHSKNLNLQQLHVSKTQKTKSSRQNNGYYLDECCPVGPHTNEHTACLYSIPSSFQWRRGGQRLHTTGTTTTNLNTGNQTMCCYIPQPCAINWSSPPFPQEAKKQQVWVSLVWFKLVSLLGFHLHNLYGGNGEAQERDD